MRSGSGLVEDAAPQTTECEAQTGGPGRVLVIEDDGLGSSPQEGNGLRGMRERVEALGGNLQRQTSSGTRLSIRFPLAKADGGH